MPRINKSKKQILDEVKQKEKIARNTALAKLIFPFLSEMKTIYDAQTALNAVAGFIEYEIEKKVQDINVKELDINFDEEKDPQFKIVLENIFNQVSTENAKESAELLQAFAKTLELYGAKQYLKNPMSTLKMSDIIAG